MSAFEMENSRFVSNQALLSESNSIGGAIYIDTQKALSLDITVYKSQIEGNIAKNGGAIYCLSFIGNTLLYIAESTFSGNYAVQGGILSM